MELEHDEAGSGTGSRPDLYPAKEFARERADGVGESSEDQ